MSVQLKIKSKALAVESTIIRKEERKLGKQLKYLCNPKTGEQIMLNEDYYARGGGNSEYTPEILSLVETRESLSTHRKTTVRQEARATHLARAYIAGQDYLSVEASRKPAKEAWEFPYVQGRVESIVKKYAPSRVNELRTWYFGGSIEKLPLGMEAVNTGLTPSVINTLLRKVIG